MKRGPRGLMPSPWMLDDKPLGVKVVFITVPRFHPAKPEPSSEPWKKCGSALSLTPTPWRTFHSQTITNHWQMQIDIIHHQQQQSLYYKPLTDANK